MARAQAKGFLAINKWVHTLAAVLLIESAAAGDWWFRCRGGLVSPGDTVAQVRKRCGRPTYERTYEIFARVREGDTTAVSPYPVSITEWIYGSTAKFPRRLVFRGGNLQSIERLARR